MAQSQNSTVDLTIKATSFAGMGTYGSLMVGNAALEFYNERNPEDYIQIPWGEIDHIAAEVVGKKITRFAVFIRQGNHFAFSTRDNKATLRAVRTYVATTSSCARRRLPMWSRRASAAWASASRASRSAATADSKKTERGRFPQGAGLVACPYVWPGLPQQPRDHRDQCDDHAHDGLATQQARGHDDARVVVVELARARLATRQLVVDQLDRSADGRRK